MCCEGTPGPPKLRKALQAFNAIAMGAWGVAKAILEIDPAPLEAVEKRRKICASCESAAPCKLSPGKRCWCGPVWDGITGERETCGCNIEYKTLVASESCPLGKWPAVPSNKET